MKDREGTVWAVTSEGLDSFRDVPITTFTTREGAGLSEMDGLLAGRDGTLWIGGDGSLDSFRAGQFTSLRPADGLPGSQVTALLEDHNGALWIGVERGLFVYRGKKFHAVRTREGNSTGLVVDLAEDIGGNIWAEVSASPRKLLRIEGLTVQEEYPAPEMPEARRIVADPRGGVWLGLMDGNLARLREGKLEKYVYRPDAKFSFENEIEHIHVDPDGAVLAASVAGLIGWKAGIQRTLTSRNGLPCDSIQGFLTDDEGNLWLYMQCGIAGITKDQLAAWWQTSNFTVQPRLLDSLDGAKPGRMPPFVSAAKTTDGRLWFTNGSALQMIDPVNLRTNAVPPPVHIEAVIADRKSYFPTGDLRLPERTRDIEIDYVGLSFVAPQKVRFRYRLHGHETLWQEPGGRRQALYNDLEPGNYSFQVIAANNDGIWNDTGDTLHFSVAPAWYQTLAFRLLCIALCATMLWLIHRVRMWQVAKTLSARFNERMSERARLAREFHDTLLQTVQGSKLIVDSALSTVGDPTHHREKLERLSKWLESAIAEGRAALSSLRSSTTQRNDLAESLRGATQDNPPDTMTIEFDINGRARDMHPIARDEISRIGCEAIRNALRHSGGSKLSIELDYSSELRLCVKDNGKGIVPAILQHGAVGHFGLSGMQERAKNIGGTLRFTSPKDGGTQVELIVPGHLIYERGHRSTE
ncbi:MAG: two-component regulator propeller domain-containing protein [Steroidobacteraceae bacterium]